MLPLPRQLLNGNNAEVLQYLDPLSCHGDNIQSLQTVLSSCPDVTAFCPDTANYRYFIWYIQATVFAYGVGMHNVSLRIPQDMIPAATAQDLEPHRFDGEFWYSFPYDYAELGDVIELALEHARS